MESTLARKVSQVSVSRSPIPDIDYLANRFINALETTLKPLIKTSVAGSMAEAEVTKLGQITEGIPVPAMLGILGMPGAANQSMVHVSGELAFHFIDLIMGGDSSSTSQPSVRSYTDIDCAICGIAVRAVARAFEEAVELTLDGPLETKFELSSIIQNITDVNIAPQNADILTLNVVLDIGEAARTGTVNLIVPLSVLDLIRASVKSDVREVVSVNDVWRNRMRQAVEEAQIPLTAVLHRDRYTPSDLRALKVGQILPVPGKAPKELSLVLLPGQKNEQIFVEAQLGAYEGRKVVRLNETPNEVMVEYLQSAIQDD